MSHTTDSMTFDIFKGIFFFSLLLFPGHGDIEKVFGDAINVRTFEDYIIIYRPKSN